MEHKKKFLIIGSQNAITYKDFFPLLKENKVWLGVHTRAMAFEVPPTYDGAVKNDEDGKYYKKLGNVCWFTNLDHERRRQKMTLYKRYNSKEYPTYDNYEAIEVSEAKLIPKDYAGIMGVPVSWLSKYNPDQFEIIGSSLELANPAKDLFKKGTYQQGGNALYSSAVTEDDIKKGFSHHRYFPRILIRNKNPKQPKSRKE